MLSDVQLGALAARIYMYQANAYEDMLGRMAPPAMRHVRRVIPSLDSLDLDTQAAWLGTAKALLDAYPEIAFDRTYLADANLVRSGRLIRAAESAYALSQVLLDGDLDQIRQFRYELDVRLSALEE